MYLPLVALMFIWLLVTVVGLVISGQNLIMIAIVAAIAFGFLSTFFPKYGYYGSLAAAYATILLISLHIYVSFLVPNVYLVLAVGGASLISLRLLHYFARTRMPISHNLTFMLVVIYMLTTLLIFYLEGTQPGTDMWVIGTAYSSILILYVIPLDFGFRQKEIIPIINIGDLDVYSKMADRLEARIKLTNKQELQEEAENEIEKIVSDLQNAVDAFLSGYYDGAIINSCNVREGLNRIFHNWLNVDDEVKFLEDEFEAQSEWRQNIAHSNVRNLLVSEATKKEKQEKKCKKMENHYIAVVKTNYQKALYSIRFALQAMDYLCQYQL
jgi:hypothetical protein